ncbi:hypothetical protein VNI00_002047 [Paramarasmius palmivorus]|uniref:Arrestin C-terminal-like domain-containing protein n=1 Tax=Paramarasmius palmivorus TaxID=297713 RepID=A0AAW0E662_9AGAR
MTMFDDNPLDGKSALSRHGTLLSSGASPARNAAELKVALGNAHSRLKPGASLLQDDSRFDSPTDTTVLEQAKSRARVEVDLILERYVCCQGGYVNGVVKLRIRKRSKDEGMVMVSGGKIRVIGFESIQNEAHRHLFYQQSAPLLDIAPNSASLLDSIPDNEGFCEAKDGIYAFPFSMFLPPAGQFGNAKGVITPHGGAAVRSIKVKERETDKRSIAHFYRDCEVWPRLNPSSVLSPSREPVQATSSKSLFMGGNGQVTLVAAMHRRYWVAGQQCPVKVKITNHSKKTIKSVTLTLVRSTTIFKAADSDESYHEPTPVHKPVAESTLEMGHRGARGHASAKGWWTGVDSDETLEFSHLLLIPSDALSIEKSQLVQVEYTLRVGVSAGPLASDLHVTLPITIINFFSIDPPPTFPTLHENLMSLDSDYREFLYAPLICPPSARQSLEYDRTGSEDAVLPEEDQIAYQAGEDLEDEQPILGDFPSPEDDDDFVQRTLAHMAVDAKYAEHGRRFSDLYYASVQDGLADIGRNALETHSETLTIDVERADSYEDTEESLVSPHSRESSARSSHYGTPTQRHSRHSTFSQRVQQKLEESKALGHTNEERTETVTAEKRTEVVRRTPSIASTRLSIETSSSGYASDTLRTRSSTMGSYFRPRNEIPDEIEHFEEDYMQSPIEDDILRSSQTVPDLYEQQRLGSRTFGPRPRLKSTVVTRPHSDASSGSASEDDGTETPYTTPSDSPLEEKGNTGPLAQRVAQLEYEHYVAQFHHVPPSPSHSSLITRPGRTRAHTMSALPNPRAELVGLRANTSDYPMKGELPTASGSVRDRIRQLEERTRAAERVVEASGPL